MLERYPAYITNQREKLYRVNDDLSGSRPFFFVIFFGLGSRSNPFLFTKVDEEKKIWSCPFAGHLCPADREKRTKIKLNLHLVFICIICIYLHSIHIFTSSACIIKFYLMYFLRFIIYLTIIYLPW